MIMTKKHYEQPTTRIVEFRQQNRFLLASGGASGTLGGLSGYTYDNTTGAQNPFGF